ncbi:DUF6452 family protein [Tenacibaculum jejuense]|uniref:Lipoprotein n=1 Tax=Tenacibaculum jejuense TaxID=584609 RepID=A0A238UB01_9FLAO|nr:DUF6452 family protein [Tenacibaculum jejuense]SNR16377.1 conserved exported protein of unknown function [Tenacibaculum jejuense]
MRFLKYAIILFVATICFLSCEKDDFCTQNPVTPNLVLRFYNNKSLTEFKAVERFTMSTGGVTLFSNISTDSIAIPLNTIAEETVFTLIRNETDNDDNTGDESATLTVKYIPENEYVSRSCGFRVIFNDVTFETSGWIERLSTTQLESIKNQTNAHVNIFH